MPSNKRSEDKSPVAICIIVENETVPHDRRVWLEALALTQAGYKVSVICPIGILCNVRRETREGIDIYRYWSLRARGRIAHLFEYLWALLAQIYLALVVYSRTQFRILQACNPPDTTFLIGFLFKLLGVRFVFDHHDLTPEFYLSRYKKRGLLYQLALIAEWLSFRTADMCLATNESFRQIAIKRGGMRPDRVVVVQTCAALCSELGSSDSQLKLGRQHLVVYVGQMEPQDGVELLLRSIRYIVKEKGRTDTLFVLIGSGTELPRLRALANQWEISDYISFTGRIPHKEVGPYLATADVCVAPDPLNSLNDSCSMIKIFEYMAYAKPVVLYDLREGRRSAAGAALYARPNDTQDFADQVTKLLDSAVLRNELGKSGRRRVENGLNWDAQSNKLLLTFETLLMQSEIAGRRKVLNSARATRGYNAAILKLPRSMKASGDVESNPEVDVVSSLTAVSASRV